MQLAYLHVVVLSVSLFRQLVRFGLCGSVFEVVENGSGLCAWSLSAGCSVVLESLSQVDFYIIIELNCFWGRAHGSRLLRPTAYRGTSI